MTDARPVRAPGLEVHEVDDGIVVYQPAADRVHYLNQSAAVVFELCTGENSEDEIADLVRSAWDLAEPPRDEVLAGLARLREEGVVK